MRMFALRLGMMLVWIDLAILCSIFYGIVNDQITVTLSPEYFSVFKRAQFGPALELAGLARSPTRAQAILVGSLATWWFGGFLGIALSAAGIAGRRPPLPTRDFLRAVSKIMLVTLCLSVLFGGVAFLVEPAVKPDTVRWPFLYGIQEVRSAFAIGWWHNGAYLGGVLGTVMASVWMWKQRSKAENTSPSGANP